MFESPSDSSITKITVTKETVENGKAEIMRKASLKNTVAAGIYRFQLPF